MPKRSAAVAFSEDASQSVEDGVRKPCSTEVIQKQHEAFPSIELYDEIVVIEVGPSRKKFSCHKGLLCYHSTYYTSAFQGDWKEAHDKVVKLDQDSEEVFGAVYSWLYTRKLPDYWLPENATNDNFTKAQMTMAFLAKVWVFGDARGMPGLQNAVIDQHIDIFLDAWIRPHTQEITFVWSNTVGNSPLRKLNADICVYSDFVEFTTPKNFPAASWRDMAYTLHANTGLRLRNRHEWRAVDKCKYHVH